MIWKRRGQSEFRLGSGPDNVVRSPDDTSGMRTIYIRRATEDMDINDEKLHSYGFDLIVNEGGLIELARRLGCEV